MIDIAKAARANAIYRKNLGWTASELGGPPEEGALAKYIGLLQANYGVTVDGVAGPNTYTAFLKDRRRRLVSYADSLPATADKVEVYGRCAVATAKMSWLLNILDGKKGAYPERSRQWIDRIIRTPAGVNWSWLKPYLGDGQREWCGDFVASCYGEEGAQVDLDLRCFFFPSTDRLYNFAHYEDLQSKKNPEPPEGAPRRMVITLDEHSKPSDVVFEDGTTIREGDIGLVGGVNTGPGKHVVLFTGGFDARTGVATTIEGNTFGQCL